ncbi:MAG: hypothetical protein MRK01_05640 [Candidatus Scalindua sp.]|nr:hypothetical protein [Candidatus Scalindua sp.]
MKKTEKKIDREASQTGNPEKSKIIKAKDREIVKNLKLLKRSGGRHLRVKPWIGNLHALQNKDSVREAVTIIQEIQTLHSKKEISQPKKEAATGTHSSFPTRGKIPEKWLTTLMQHEVPEKYHGTMGEIVNHFIDSQVVMNDNEAEMEAAISLVKNHARLNCLGRLQSGEYVPLSIVEDFGKSFQYIIIHNGRKHLFSLKNVRVMFQGNPEVYIGRLSARFDPQLFAKSHDFKQLLWEIGVIFRKGDGQGKRKRDVFYGPDKDDRSIMLPYYWDYRKTMDKVVMVGLFPNHKVRIIAEQPPEKFSSYAFSLFGDVPITQAKEIVGKVNVTMNLFRNARPRFPEIYFDRARALLIITNRSLTYGIRVEKAGSVEVEKIEVESISPRWESFTKIINYSRDEGIRRSRKKAICPLFEYLSNPDFRSNCIEKSELVQMGQRIQANS